MTRKKAKKATRTVPKVNKKLLDYINAPNLPRGVKLIYNTTTAATHEVVRRLHVYWGDAIGVKYRVTVRCCFEYKGRRFYIHSPEFDPVLAAHDVFLVASESVSGARVTQDRNLESYRTVEQVINDTVFLVDTYWEKWNTDRTIRNIQRTFEENVKGTIPCLILYATGVI